MSVSPGFCWRYAGVNNRPAGPVHWRQLAVSLMVIVVPALAAAQSTLGTVRGTVFDPQRQVVPAAAVLITDENTGVPRVVETNAVGNFEAVNLRAGSYRLEISAPGFTPVQISGVLLRAGETTRADATLEVGAGQEEVTVTARAGAIQLESQAISGTVTAEQLETLPRTSREFQDFLYLDPNVVGDMAGSGFQFLGGRTYGVSFVQDGQRSTGGIFGNVGSSSPNIDAISEIKVLSNSYSAEYGGLAGVVVTTRRGLGRYSGSGFFDVNANELNARTFTQALEGLERSDPTLDTNLQRWGGSLGGPILKNRTFFFGAYDGFTSKSSAFSNFATVPTEAMRNGDFSNTPLVIRDPLTGQPFQDNVIPANRLDPGSQAVMDFFYPAPNQTPLANGYGRYRVPINPGNQRHRYDLRVDHELANNSSVFVRGSWQRADPETTLENALYPQLGFQDRSVTGRTLASSWTHIFGPSVLNELRVGLNRDRSNRRSLFNAGEMADRFGFEVPEAGRNRVGYQSYNFQGDNMPSIIRDQRQNSLRDIKTDSFSLANTFSWVTTRHSLRVGGLFAHTSVLDGFSAGANEGSGEYRFDGSFTGNAFSDFLLGLPYESFQQVNTRGGAPLEATSNEFAIFVQDDWKVNTSLTLFLGVRYEVLGNFVEKNDVLINFEQETGSFILPNPEIFNFLGPGAQETVPTIVASDLGVGRSLVKNDTNNVSPRVGFAYRLDESNRTVLRGGVGLFYPTQAAQGIRDALSRNPFRYSVRRESPDYHEAFSTGSLITSPGFGVNGVDPSLESAEVVQYNITLEREILGDLGVRATYMGSRMRKLLVNRDINTVPPSTQFFDPDDPEDRLRLPYPNLGNFLNMVLNAGSGRFDALQLEVRRPLLRGLQFQTAYTLSYSDSNAPDLGNSSLGVVQYNPYDIEEDRGPDPNIPRHRVVANAVWDVPIGRLRSYLSSMPPWADALAGGWTVSAIFQARTGAFLTPYFSYGTDPTFPANTGKAYDTNNSFGEAWKPDVIRDPKGPRRPEEWYNLAAFALPAEGTTGNAKRGIITGPGTWVANLGLYKDIVRTRGMRAEFRATFDNLFNHPQFLITPWSGMLNLSPYLIDGLTEDGVMNTMNEITSAENFAEGRRITLGVRVTF
ncbi:MAG: TonB-dependent receptor plug domain-containing protein [Luteitalea sp.]|nr:TonB-dependent receptor plug domain-containing protein [Luteitalea sp.]